MQIDLTNDGAREYFKNKNLNYSDITDGEILLLIMLINKELKRHRKEIPDMSLKLSRKIKSRHNTNGLIKECYLFCNGSYFLRREAISFNTNGWIGFAGWASSKNVEPFITAFIKWCDLITEDKLDNEIALQRLNNEDDKIITLEEMKEITD